MTKTDFAELKRVLCEFDILDSSDDFDEYVKQFPVVANSGYSRGITHSYWQTSARHQHTKSAAIISELIEIISYQESLIESNFKRSKETAIWIEKKQFENDEYDGEWYVKSTEPFNELEIIRENCKEALSETTTRLQKLRDGNNGNKTN